MLHSNTEQCSSQLLLQSQLTPHKEHTLSKSLKLFKQPQFISHTEDNLSQALLYPQQSRHYIQLPLQPVSFHLISHMSQL